MASLTDSELIKLAIDGDQDAFTELVCRYRNAVYGYCYYRASSFEDARDLCQETFILAYGKLGQLRDSDKLGAWLRKIATNLCVRWYKKQREVPVENVILPEQTPESPRAMLVREALSDLPDKERLAVVMHYVDGLSYGEIAGFLETSNPTIKGRLYRGREMLKEEVLKMTRDTFGENKLDDEFILKSVRLALDESQKACWEKKDTKLARRKTDEAIEMLDRLGSGSIQAEQAKYEALMRTVHTTLDLSEREELINNALDFGIQSCDALVAAEALRARAENLVWKRDLDKAQELLERARDIASRNKLAVQLAFCNALEADIAFLMGNTEKSRTLFRQALDQLREAQSTTPLDLTWYIALLQSELTALDSLPSGSTGLLLYHSAGQFQVESDKILLQAHVRGNLLSRADFKVPPRVPVLPNALPLFDLGWPEPDQLLALPPQVGHSWNSETRELNEWYRLDSVIESDSDSINIGLGQFDHCLRVVKRLSGPKRQGADLERQIYGTRTIWFAPGVGVVKTIHEPDDGETVTAELVAYHVLESDSYFPHEVGNWWKYRWVEGEEHYGYRTENYLEITQPQPNGQLFIQRYITCVRE